MQADALLICGFCGEDDHSTTEHYRQLVRPPSTHRAMASATPKGRQRARGPMYRHRLFEITHQRAMARGQGVHAFCQVLDIPTRYIYRPRLSLDVIDRICCALGVWIDDALIDEAPA